MGVALTWHGTPTVCLDLNNNLLAGLLTRSSQSYCCLCIDHIFQNRVDWLSELKYSIFYLEGKEEEKKTTQCLSLMFCFLSLRSLSRMQTGMLSRPEPKGTPENWAVKHSVASWRLSSIIKKVPHLSVPIGLSAGKESVPSCSWKSAAIKYVEKGVH